MNEVECVVGCMHEPSNLLMITGAAKMLMAFILSASFAGIMLIFFVLIPPRNWLMLRKSRKGNLTLADQTRLAGHRPPELYIWETSPSIIRGHFWTIPLCFVASIICLIIGIVLSIR